MKHFEINADGHYDLISDSNPAQAFHQIPRAD